jgi:hypothetical protein
MRADDEWRQRHVGTIVFRKNAYMPTS